MTHYEGSCHCGAVTFEVSGKIEKGMMCDCSICKRKSALMGAVPPEDFTLKTGAENLSLYQFNTMAAMHYFCKTCGIYTHHKRRRDEFIGFNTGCLDGFDKDQLDEIIQVPGSTFSLAGEED